MNFMEIIYKWKIVAYNEYINAKRMIAHKTRSKRINWESVRNADSPDLSETLGVRPGNLCQQAIRVRVISSKIGELRIHGPHTPPTSRQTYFLDGFPLHV